MEVKNSTITVKQVPYIVQYNQAKGRMTIIDGRNFSHVGYVNSLDRNEAVKALRHVNSALELGRKMKKAGIELANGFIPFPTSRKKNENGIEAVTVTE